MQRPEFALIVNPGSGSSDEETLQKVRDALKQSGRPFICLETHPDDGAAPAIKEAIGKGVQTVVVCGGDGTVMSAVNALGNTDSDIKLAIVPGGTANLLARALKIPLDTDGAIQVVLEGDERRIDMGACGETLFALGMGLGLTEKLVSESSSEEKERLGKWAYVKSLVEEIGAKPSTFTYTLDDGEEQTTQGVAVIVANAGKLSGNIEFAPDAKMDDGKLNLVVLHHLNARDMLRLGWKALWGQTKSDRALTCLEGRTIDLRCDPPLDLQIDGEVVELQPPLRVEVRPGALRVAAPGDEQQKSLMESLVQKVAESSGPKVSRPQWWHVISVVALLGSVAWLVLRRRAR